MTDHIHSLVYILCFIKKLKIRTAYVVDLPCLLLYCVCRQKTVNEIGNIWERQEQKINAALKDLRKI